MKIIMLSILFITRVQSIDQESTTISFEITSNKDSFITNNGNITNPFDLSTETIRLTNDSMLFSSEETPSLLTLDSFSSLPSVEYTIGDLLSSQFDTTEKNLMTISSENISKSDLDEDQSTYESQTWPSLFARDRWTLSSLAESTEFDSTISTPERTGEESWFNVNQSGQNRFLPLWKRIDDSSSYGAVYRMESDARCMRQMCSVKLIYNGSLSSHRAGCLSFSLWTRGQPIGQLWIDDGRDTLSQKIQLTNKTLRIEHSLRPRIKHLSIEARVLFRDPSIDTVTVANLNVEWKGVCPRRRSVPTYSPVIMGRRATLEDDLMTMSSEGSGLMSTLASSEGLDSSQTDLIFQSTSDEFRAETTTRRLSSFANRSNVGWVLSAVITFCCLLILATIAYGLWTLRRRHRFTWYVTFDSPIQFLARRSIRSSTRSNNKIATVSQIAYDLLHSDNQQEHSNTPTTSSSRSTPNSYYTYL